MDHDGRHGARCFIRRDRHHAAIRADALHPARRQQHALPGMRIAPRGTYRRAALGRERRAVGPESGTAVRATWRDAHTGQSVLLAPGRVQRVGPYGGVMTVAADEATGAVAP
ncbi:hypothetical protein QM334_23720, partial [Burkholderia cenocepacia]|nr:hypothetical protein [Burkholderia cenocepacia]